MTIPRLISDEIYEVLYSKISSGEWSLGDKIPSEQEICKQMSASRISVRTAIHKLQAQNLIVTYPGRGSFVINNSVVLKAYDDIDISAEDYRYMIELRHALEFTSIEILCRNGIQEDFDELESAYNDMLVSEDEESYVDADLRFHYGIVAGAHNPIFSKIYETIRPEFRNYLSQLSGNNRDNNWSNAKQNHKKILDFIKKRDSKSAIELIENTFEYNYQRLNKYFK